MVTDAHRAAAKRLLDPILDVMGGADGGIAFSKLRHMILPAALAQMPDHESIRAIEIVSILCQRLLNKDTL